MRKLLSAALAAVTVAGAVMPAGAASAQRYYYSHGHYYRHRDNSGAAVAAGIAGLAIGAALASNSGNHRYYNDGYYSRGYYDGGYYPPGYYDPGYGYYAPRRCRTDRIWDPYIDRWVERTRCW